MRHWLTLKRNAHAIPAPLWNQAVLRLAYTASLPAEDQDRLRHLVLEFLQIKTFQGAGGFRITDIVRLEIAVQACVLILNLGLETYSSWREIIVYPDDFIVQREETDEAGVVHTWLDELAGESWDQGPVILSWNTLISTAPDTNIVIHEFAHKLDSGNGTANGCPPLPGHILPQRWSDTFGSAYLDFCEAVDEGKPVLIDEYAAESPAEFFAVLCEQFFLQPRLVNVEYPEIYSLLKELFRQDPRMIMGAS